MDPKVKKLVFVVQDLETKDKEKVAVVSGDVHYYKDAKAIIAKKTTVASFQLLLDDNKSFSRHIKSLVAEAIALKEGSVTKKK